MHHSSYPKPTKENGTLEQLELLEYFTKKALTLRLDPELKQALGALSVSEGLSRQEVIRRAILDRYERSGHQQRVDDAATTALDRWNDVLNRLGSV